MSLAVFEALIVQLDEIHALHHISEPLVGVHFIGLKQRQLINTFDIEEVQLHGVLLRINVPLRHVEVAPHVHGRRVC